MSTSADTWSRRFVWCALACFCIALAAPVVEGGNLRGQATDFPGWLVMPLSLLLGMDAVMDGLVEGGRMSWPSLAAGLAALANLNFVVGGVWLQQRCETGRLAAYLGVALPCGLILAIVSPLAMEKGGDLLPGFYVWLLAQCLLLAAVGLAWKSSHTGITEH